MACRFLFQSKRQLSIVTNYLMVFIQKTQKKAMSVLPFPIPVNSCAWSTFTAWIFFSGFLFATVCISCVYNCDDLPSNNSSLRSSHMWFSCIHNFKSETCFNQSEALWVVTPHWSSSVDMKSLCALVRRRFTGEPVVVGHSQANRQSILKLSAHCFFVEGYFLTSHYIMIQKVFKLTYSLKKLWNRKI